MKSYIPRNLLLLFALLFGWQIATASNQYNIHQLAISEGLLSNTINTIVCDNVGTVWVGSNGGINRVYGGNVRVYEPNVEGVASFQKALVRQILCDQRGDIWAVVQNRVFRYNANQDDFEVVDMEEGRVVTAFSISMCEGGLIFGGNGQIVRYSYDTQRCEVIYRSLQGGALSIGYLAQVDENHLIISGNATGVYLVDLLSREQILIDKPELTIYSPGILLDRERRLWIPNIGKGIDCFDLSGDIPTLVRSYTPQNSNLNSNSSTYILYGEEGKLWIATDGGGINILDLESDTISQLSVKVGEKSTPFLLSSRVICRDEDVWYVGSAKGGLLTLKESHIDSYGVNPFDLKLGPSYPAINSCYEDHDGRVWLGTDGDGLNIFDPRTGLFERVESTAGSKVVTTVELNRDNLLIYIYATGLFALNKHTRELSPIDIYNRDASTRKMIIDTVPLGEDQVMILGWRRLIYDHKQGTLQPISVEGNVDRDQLIRYNYNSPSGRRIAYSSSNIYEIEQSEDDKYILRSIYSSDQIIITATTDSRGDVWFCDGEGLKLLDPEEEEGCRFCHNPNVKIGAMICDSYDRLWMGSQRGLFCYLADQHRVYHYGVADGVQISDYFIHASIVHSSGDVYFGGLDGLLRIYEDTPMIKSRHTEPTLISIVVDNENFVIDKEQSIAEVVLPHDYSSVLLSVAIEGLNILTPRKITYTIAGGSYSRVVEEYDNELLVSQLPPSRYDIMVSYAAPDGVTVSPVKIATLEVLPPVWKRWWMILVYMIIMFGAVISFTLVVLSRRRQRLQWLLERNEKQMADEKVRFMINISHELRTPLTLIYAPIKRLLQSGELNQSSRESLTKVFLQAQNTFNLVNMVLDVRKLEVKRHRLSLECVAINRWIGSIVEEFVEEFKINGILLTTDLAEEVPDIFIDQKMCKSVLSNLLMNAQKYVSSPGRVSVESRCVDGYVRVAVVDNGVGVAPKDLNSLCDRFFQSSNNNAGYGIGLSYSKEIIELHSGRLGAMNNDTEGATFFFELPLAIPESVAVKSDVNIGMSYMPQSYNVPNITDFDTSALTILVVDDNSDIIELLRDLFSPNFKQVLSAENGVEALAVIHKELPDIVISDVMMPEMDGFELCKALKTDIAISHIPIILLTARGDVQSTILGNKMGADNYISKPFDPELLLCVVGNELRKRASVKEHLKLDTATVDPALHTYSTADYNFMEQMNEFILSNLSNEQLGLDMILRHIGMSRTSFKNKLFAITSQNINISQYINNFRVEEAKRLLASSDMPISEIAFMVGFSSATYFSTAFKKHTGLTPNAYRSEL